jgi:(R,R)-butanediol dehydrogenase/meso-butanediol dehydrogenase/diacetyl reductase
MAGVHAVDPEGSVFWGLLIIGLMIAQIVQATRPERPTKAAQPEADEVSGSSECGPRELVQGAGPIGLLTAQHARHAGAGAVVIVEPVEARRETARRLGFTDVHAPGEGFTARVLELTDGLGADVLYECTGASSLFQSSAELVRRGGTLALLGYPMTTSEVSYGDWQSRELTVVGSLAYTHSDFVGAMRSLADGSVEAGPLITGTVGLDELPGLLVELDSGETEHAKVLVAPNG